MMMAKFMKLFSLIDDTYDSYGTLEELQPLTDVIQRFLCYLRNLYTRAKHLLQHIKFLVIDRMKFLIYT